LPIFAAAFGGPGLLEFFEWDFCHELEYRRGGHAGKHSGRHRQNINFYCNMVGTGAFPACASKVGNVGGAGYPINFWQVNPFSSGRAVNYLDAAGSSNYHGLQIEFRQSRCTGRSST